MCGIAGIHSSSTRIERVWLERMQRCLLHRGPDDAGIEVSPDKGWRWLTHVFPLST